MGGYIGLESDKSEYIRGQVTPEHKIQESIDALNAARIALNSSFVCDASITSPVVYVLILLAYSAIIYLLPPGVNSN